LVPEPNFFFPPTLSRRAAPPPGVPLSLSGRRPPCCRPPPSGPSSPSRRRPWWRREQRPRALRPSPPAADDPAAARPGRSLRAQPLAAATPSRSTPSTPSRRDRRPDPRRACPLPRRVATPCRSDRPAGSLCAPLPLHLRPAQAPPPLCWSRPSAAAPSLHASSPRWPCSPPPLRRSHSRRLLVWGRRCPRRPRWSSLGRGSSADGALPPLCAQLRPGHVPVPRGALRRARRAPRASSVPSASVVVSPCTGATAGLLFPSGRPSSLLAQLRFFYQCCPHPHRFHGVTPAIHELYLASRSCDCACTPPQRSSHPGHVRVLRSCLEPYSPGLCRDPPSGRPSRAWTACFPMCCDRLTSG
jgi:hypothetical protein